MYTESIVLTEKNELIIVDQTLLPRQLKYININGLDDSIGAIKKLKIRGAPAIGIMAAYTLFIIASKLKSFPKARFFEELDSASVTIKNSRPTAVNLAWAINRIKGILSANKERDLVELVKMIKEESIKIHSEDRDSCRQIGINGLEIVPEEANIITHCNTGSLATGGWGTALGIIYAAAEKNIRMHVYVDETRPLGQGARLTFWELSQAGIPCTLITDSSAASLMAAGKINLALFGADRIAKNGDVANKIGSYNLAVAANYHKIPCYSAAPISTFDFDIKSGSDIPIEIRESNEILDIYNFQNLNNNFSVYNPAFDITPAELLSGIITEKGIIKNPLDKNISKIINYN
jgi:methylthioribose-1-phosphate isomerase